MADNSEIYTRPINFVGVGASRYNGAHGLSDIANQFSTDSGSASKIQHQANST